MAGRPPRLEAGWDLSSEEEPVEADDGLDQAPVKRRRGRPRKVQQDVVVAVERPLENTCVRSDLAKLADSIGRVSPCSTILGEVLQHAASKQPGEHRLVEYLLGSRPRTVMGGGAEARMLGTAEHTLSRNILTAAAAVYGGSLGLAASALVRMLAQFRTGALRPVAVLSHDVVRRDAASLPHA